MRHALIAVVVVVVLVSLGLCLRHASSGSAGPGPMGQDLTRKILIIGIDGLDWAIIDRVHRDVGMPNIDGLRREGAHGVLYSVPPYLSPSIWTSIATGKTQEKHGIAGFLVDRGKTVDPTPTSSNMRKAKALWQILSSAGRTVGFTGWLVTSPAESVNGYMLSSHTNLLVKWNMAPRAPGDDRERFLQGIYPSDLYDEVAALRAAPEHLSMKELTWFIGTEEHLDDAEVESELNTLRRIYGGDLTLLAIADHLLGTRHVDLSAVYLRGLDSTCHTFWRYFEPDSWTREPLSPRLVETYGTVIERYYAKMDSMIGVILSSCDEGTTVIVCSDHGFAGHRGYPGFEGDLASGTQMHRAEGIIVLKGPGVTAGAVIEGASVLDVAPTVLALFGLPVGLDMDGRVLTEAFDESVFDLYPVTFIDTYESSEPVSDEEPIPSPVDDEIKERLRSLGYID